MTPRGIAAVVVEHVPLTMQRVRGEYGEAGEVRAEVDYGVDPEGSEDGESLTIRTSVLADAGRFACRPDETGCSSEDVEGGTLTYRWDEGEPEEDPGYVGYLFVAPDHAVSVTMDGPFIDADPATMDLGIGLEVLRAVALDRRLAPEMAADDLEAGDEVEPFEGENSPPTKPVWVAMPPEKLAARVVVYLGTPVSGRPSGLTELGPDAVGVHLEYPAYALDLLTVAGKHPATDPPGTTREQGRVRLAGRQEDDHTGQTESVLILVTAKDPAAVPVGDLSALVDDLIIGPTTDDPGGFDAVPGWSAS